MLDLGYVLIAEIAQDDWYVDPAVVDVERVTKAVMDHLGISDAT
jgi:phenylpyruvate tautomerase PptA (4-oxalocrotonate tautomerase family)